MVSDVYIKPSLISELGCNSFAKNLSVTTMHHKNALTKTRVINNLEILDLDENESELIPVAYSRDPWPFDENDSPKSSDINNFSYLKNIPFNFIDSDIGILLGLNHSEVMKPLRVVSSEDENTPYATLHKFGWALNGPVHNNSNLNKKCFRIKTESVSEINRQFREFCSREFIDPNPCSFEPSVLDKMWNEKVLNSLKKGSDNKFEICLPFKDDLVSFPDNRKQVLSRLMSSKKKLESNTEFYEEYCDFMNLMLNNNFAEKVPEEELVTEPGKSWYLFHFGVYHKRKNKLRIVFDASLKYDGISLNSSLLQGPDLTNSLLGVLLRFRENKFALSGDIEKMFYNIRVPKNQRDFLRFLWFPDNDLTKEPAVYRVVVHIFGAVSSPSIANFALRNSALTTQAQKFSSKVRDTVGKNFYVDDLMISADTHYELNQLKIDVTEMLSDSGFKLTNFSSNSRFVLKNMIPNELSPNFRLIDLKKDELPNERALGVLWEVENDNFCFKVNLPEKSSTKRNVLSTVFSVYDPIGFISPVLLPAKKLFQMTCHENLSWDDPLSEDIKNRWKAWLNDLQLLENFKIPRCIKPLTDITEIQLHLFSDGSEIAYASTCYLRCLAGNNQVSCSFIISKSHLVPLKGNSVSTIPRIELNAAKLSVNLYLKLMNELTINIDEAYFWTDSMSVLKYINNVNSRYQRFVANRISFIREHSKVENWCYVPSNQNPADIATRPIDVNKFLNCSVWTEGPKFLGESKSSWPKINDKLELPENDPEIIKSKLVFCSNLSDKSINILFESSSSWYIIRIRVAWILQFMYNLKNKDWSTKKLTLNIINEAENAIWRIIQNSYFHSTLLSLKTKNLIPKNDRLIKLNPFIDNSGLLRVGGRLENSTAPFETKHPLIIPNNHHLSKVLINHIHITFGHSGRETVLSQLRLKYWMVGASTTVKQVLSKCIICRKNQGRACDQIMADLPKERLDFDKPIFSNVGIDVFGPFLVKRGRVEVKRYGLIFVCLASCAVHIELLFTLDSSSCINAIRRFIARRGGIKIIFSDNGTNFVSADKVLRKSVTNWNTTYIDNWLQQTSIEWKFRPPEASHYGGYWEREIRTIRKVMNGLTNVQPINLDDEGLNTLFCEVESILNSKPLTNISNDISDLEALTPNHLLLCRSGATFPPGLFDKNDCFIQRKWKQIQYLADVFWSRWRKQYLTKLQERQKWTKIRRSMKIGDLVLLTDQQLPRNQWSMGRITKTYPDKYGFVRTVDLKISKMKGFASTTELKRPIHKLIFLMET